MSNGERLCKLDPSLIPGIDTAGYTPQLPSYRLLIRNNNKKSFPSGDLPTAQNLKRFMEQILQSVSRHEDAWPFRESVDASEVPDYYDVVKDPLDLSTMEKKLEEGNYYITLEIFASDFKRMFNNCRTYNAPETVYYKCANRLEEFFEHCISTGIITGPPLDNS